jgi:uncharacterized protein
MRHASNLGVRLARLALRGLKIAAVAYCLVLLVLLYLENMLVYPAPRYPEGDWQATWLEHEDVSFNSADGTKLHGWYVEHPQPKAVVLYCHGNGTHVAYIAEFLAEMRDEFQVSIFAFDYRGYGRSEGKPAEKGILDDAEAAQEWLAKRAGIEKQDVVLMGRSLGGGIALHLAAENGARGVILQNTFTSLHDAAASHYPWVPVRLLMKNRYDSLSRISRYSGPLVPRSFSRFPAATTTTPSRSTIFRPCTSFSILCLSLQFAFIGMIGTSRKVPRVAGNMQPPLSVGR